uniref:Peptidase A2 domain-containing protein n=1 Tax=Fagus sylvatica TaxID=28930 RepID=A0A2N9F3D7_FAGSY
MSNLKIERLATTGQSSLAKVSGRSLSIQDNNVHANKGKNVACPIGQPIISYKEMLRKEPLKVSSKSDEDDTICERCSHILAKCFSRTKKEDNYKPQEAEEPRLGSQHEQPKMARSRHDLQYEQLKMALSRLGSQYEQPRVARSRLGSQYEQPRVAQSRLGSQYEQPRVVRSRLGPQYEQPKMAWSRPNPHNTLDFRFESIRKPRMMRPPVSKIGRWVTLETPGLKPIHKQEYKYGYNPYFSRMTRTQRQRWIRQQAALHQEFGKRDHYSSRSTTNSDSMEVITRAEAPEYLRGPYARKKDITEDIKSIEDSEGIEDIEDVENIGDIEDMEDIENIEDVGDIEDMEDIENIEDIDTFENSEGIDDIEVEEADDIEEMEGSETIGCTKNGIQTGEPEIESQKPKNGKTLSCNAITLPREFMATTWVQREDDARGAVPILLAEDEECRDTGKIIFEKPTLAMCQHLKPLYIKAHMDGRPVNRVLVDNGAAVNILPTSMLRKLLKTENNLIATDIFVSGFANGVTKTKGVIPIEVKVGSKVATVAFFVVNTDSAYNALLGRDWIHSNWVVPSSLHQILVFWKDDNNIEVVKTDERPFVAYNNNVDAQLYNDCVGIVKFTGIDQNGNPSRVTVGPEEPLTMEDLFKLSQNLEETETRPEN